MEQHFALYEHREFKGGEMESDRREEWKSVCVGDFTVGCCLSSVGGTTLLTKAKRRRLENSLQKPK